MQRRGSFLATPSLFCTHSLIDTTLHNPWEASPFSLQTEGCVQRRACAHLPPNRAAGWGERGGHLHTLHKDPQLGRGKWWRSWSCSCRERSECALCLGRLQCGWGWIPSADHHQAWGAEQGAPILSPFSCGGCCSMVALEWLHLSSSLLLLLPPADPQAHPSSRSCKQHLLTSSSPVLLSVAILVSFVSLSPPPILKSGGDLLLSFSLFPSPLLASPLTARKFLLIMKGGKGCNNVTFVKEIIFGEG